MDTIGLRERHLQNDKHALYKDWFVNGCFFQDSLKQRYADAFSLGRYKHEFIPIRRRKASPFDALACNAAVGYLPLYGCQDDCCIYIYAKVAYAQHQLIWLGLAQDRYYFGSQKTVNHQLSWLPGFEPLTFQRQSFEQLYQLTT